MNVRLVDEVVVDAVAARRGAAARVVYDTDSRMPRLALEQRVDEAGLAAARGRGEHEQVSRKRAAWVAITGICVAGVRGAPTLMVRLERRGL